MAVGFGMRRRTRPVRSTLSVAFAAALVAACAGQPPAAKPAAPAPAAAVPPSPTVYFYPLRGQSAEQQDRDRYECYLWARKQTGHDPSQPRRDGTAPVQVVPSPPPGYGVAAGAATGAVIGASVSHPWDTPEGAAIGAVAGAVIGAAADASRQRAAERIEAEVNAQRAQAAARSDAAVLDYRKAMTTCLEGRGYAVR